jgi:hypothetical protein
MLVTSKDNDPHIKETESRGRWGRVKIGQYKKGEYR